MTNTQLELSLAGPRGTGSLCAGHRPPRFTSRWWFRQMRQIVDRAFEPAPPARPEQIWIPGTHRQVSAGS